MITIRPSAERGRGNYGWLDTYYSFSFANYYDPKHMGFRDLRVINEDWVSAHNGFGSHPHRDMEIITYIVDGELSHRDSTGREATIKQNDVQRMSAGTGVVHSEYNNSDAPVHLLQIWLLPEADGLKPSYEDRTFSREAKTEFATAAGDKGYKLIWTIKGPNGQALTSYNYMFKGKGDSQLLLSAMVDTPNAAKFEPVFDGFAKSLVISTGK